MPPEIQVTDTDETPDLLLTSGQRYSSFRTPVVNQITFHWLVENIGNTNLDVTSMSVVSPVGVVVVAISVAPGIILPGGSAPVAVDVFITANIWSFQFLITNTDSNENPFIAFPGSAPAGGSGTGGGGAGGGGGSGGGGGAGGGGGNPPPPAPTGGGGSGIVGTITSPQSLSLAFTPIPEYTKTDAMPLEVNRRLDEAYRVIRNMSARLAQLEEE